VQSGGGVVRAEGTSKKRTYAKTHAVSVFDKMNKTVTAYLQMDTFESIQRALVLLTTFVACGRASELAFCLVEDLEWLVLPPPL
jgi:hypothetical protein